MLRVIVASIVLAFCMSLLVLCLKPHFYYICLYRSAILCKAIKANHMTVYVCIGNSTKINSTAVLAECSAPIMIDENIKLYDSREKLVVC